MHAPFHKNNAVKFFVCATLLVVLSACGGVSAEQKTIGAACTAAGSMSGDYCECFSSNLADNLEKNDLKAYAGLMEKALDAQSGNEEDFQRLLAEAMAGGFDDPEMAIRIGQAAQAATQACVSNR